MSCGAGKYSTVSGATAEATCVDCAAGKYQDDAGTTTCKACPVNTYNEDTQSASINDCQSCGDNANSPSASQLKSACLCNVGYKLSNPGAPDDLKTCVACPVGKYHLVIDQEQCTECAAGKYSDFVAGKNETVCRVCAMGFYSGAGEASCRPCDQDSVARTSGPGAESVG